jgi:hypothetical protein
MGVFFHAKNTKSLRLYFSKGLSPLKTQRGNVMSFLLSAGDDAVNEALKPEVDTSNLLVSLSNGKSYKVRALPNAIAKYEAHSAFGVFYTTPCARKSTGQADLYDKAVDLLYKDAKALKEKGATDEEVKAANSYAYGLQAKVRYMIGFINLTTGAPIVLDFTEKQGKQVVQKLTENKEDLAEFAFKVSKSGKSSSTVVNFDLLVRPQRDLSQDEQDNFAKTAGYEFDLSLFGEVFQLADEKQQLEDLHAYGFDVTRLGFDVPTKQQPPTGAAGNEQSKPNDEEF